MKKYSSEQQQQQQQQKNMRDIQQRLAVAEREIKERKAREQREAFERRKEFAARQRKSDEPRALSRCRWCCGSGRYDKIRACGMCLGTARPMSAIQRAFLREHPSLLSYFKRTGEIPPQREKPRKTRKPATYKRTIRSGCQSGSCQ